MSLTQRKKNSLCLGVLPNWPLANRAADSGRYREPGQESQESLTALLHLLEWQGKVKLRRKMLLKYINFILFRSNKYPVITKIFVLL